jgi:hypothetical protein
MKFKNIAKRALSNADHWSASGSGGMVIVSRRSKPRRAAEAVAELKIASMPPVETPEQLRARVRASLLRRSA